MYCRRQREIWSSSTALRHTPKCYTAVTKTSSGPEPEPAPSLHRRIGGFRHFDRKVGGNVRAGLALALCMHHVHESTRAGPCTEPDVDKPQRKKSDTTDTTLFPGPFRLFLAENELRASRYGQWKHRRHEPERTPAVPNFASSGKFPVSACQAACRSSTPHTLSPAQSTAAHPWKDWRLHHLRACLPT